MRGAVFQTRHLLLALEAGDIERLHRALCLELDIVAAVVGSVVACRGRVVRGARRRRTRHDARTLGRSSSLAADVCAL
jgi:hypothetical protein